MKPHELVAALMARKGLGSLPLANALKQPGWQSKIYKFMHGQVREPGGEFALALAAFFELPLEAIYDEKIATRIATERDISALPAQIRKSRERKLEKTAEEKDAEAIAARYLKMSPIEREQLQRAMRAIASGKSREFGGVVHAPEQPESDSHSIGVARKGKAVGKLDRK